MKRDVHCRRWTIVVLCVALGLAAFGGIAFAQKNESEEAETGLPGAPELYASPASEKGENSGAVEEEAPPNAAQDGGQTEEEHDDNGGQDETGENTQAAVCGKREDCVLEDGHAGECAVKAPAALCVKVTGCVLGEGHEGECRMEAAPLVIEENELETVYGLIDALPAAEESLSDQPDLKFGGKTAEDDEALRAAMKSYREKTAAMAAQARAAYDSLAEEKKQEFDPVRLGKLAALEQALLTPVPLVRADGAVTDFEGLKAAVEGAAGPAVILVGADIFLEETITVRAGQDITLVDDGAARVISGLSADAVRMAFQIEEGGKLTLATSASGEDGLLVLDGTKVGCISTKEKGDMISCSGTFVLKGGTIQNNTCTESWSSTIVINGANASFHMTGGRIADNGFDGQMGGVIRVSSGARFVMDGGVICNNEVKLGRNINNAAVYIEAEGNSSFVMNGGTITGNHGDFGGVFIGEPAYPDFQSIAGMEMNGGTISGNTAERYGGGVMVCGQADFIMNSGTVADNEALIGGGIAVYDLYVSMGGGQSFEQWQNFFPGRFVMESGTVSGNRAARTSDKEMDSGCGGGIYIASNQAVIKGGAVTGNYADRQGGGIYVGSVPYVLRMYDTLITENTASILGGGLWFCPTGDAVNTVTNGGAIFGNKAADGAAGDDFVSVPREENGHSITLADRMLGGGEVKWYRDGGVMATQQAGGNVLGMPDGTPRYNAEDPGDRITNIRKSEEGIALKSVVADAAVQLAKAHSRVLVTGNSAPRGGGIGSNGGVVIGTPDDEWTLEVVKEWDGVAPEEYRDVHISLYLEIGGYRLDEVTLDETNRWTAEFTQLPNPDSLGNQEISVIEKETGYEVSYSELERDEANKRLAITVTNRPGPEAPTGGLMVSKTVSGSGADLTQYFDFEVRMGDTSLNGTFGGMSFADGIAVFSLKHGESKTAQGLPAGVEYTVIEQGSGGYRVEGTGTAGTIGEGTTAHAAFRNIRDPAVPDEPPADRPDGRVELPLERDPSAPKTGDESSLILWAACLALAVGGICAVLKRNRKAKA